LQAMSCPDDLTLDLWLAHALPSAEASAVAAHVAACPSCTVQQARWQADNLSLRSALELDHDERAYLANLDLATTWRAQAAPSTDARWGWLALLGIITAFIAWTIAAQPFGELLGTANLFGLGTVLLTNAVTLLLGVATSLIDVSTNPALGLAQPLLAVLALTVLFWPRIASAPRYLQGVRS
jgi:anti-sigma factor RsiW